MKYMVYLFRFGMICAVGAACFSFLPNGEEKNVDGREDLNVPFTSQAPEKNWYEPWLNACEEASILMVDSFYESDNDITVDEAKQEILDIISEKEANFDESLDESMETMMSLINELDLGWEADIVETPTLQELIVEIENGRPIIVPVYAPELGNPYYGDPAPDYHVVVLIGYDSEREIFIVNDPGTQYGDSLEFSYETLMNSIHDLNQEDYDVGRKRVLFTERI